MRSLFWFAGSTMLLAGPALAANWRQVSRGSTGAVAYIDDSSLIRNETEIGSIVDAWVQYDYSRDHTQKVRSSKELERFDCHRHTSGGISVIFYAADGHVIHSSTVPEQFITMEPVAPGTVGEDLMNAACSLPN